MKNAKAQPKSDKKFIKILVGFTLALLLIGVFATGCMYSAMRGMGMGLSDFSRDVGEGYMLFRSSSHDVQVVPKDGWGSGSAIIPSKVIALNVYHEWVFAKRQGLKSDPTNPPMQIPDDTVFDFQALNTKTNQVYIFNDETQLRQFLKQQNVPLKPLLDVYDFKEKTGGFWLVLGVEP